MTGNADGVLRAWRLDDDQVVFMTTPVSIHVSSRDANLVPALSRACGCRVGDDHRRLAVFLPTSRAVALLADLRAGGPVSVVFSRPTTNRTLQLKGAEATVEPLARGDRDLILHWADGFTDELIGLGYDSVFARAMTSGAREDAVAVSFVPLAAYEQTPGPDAGRRLGSSA
jgi:aryl carrier-like protein